MAVSTYDTIGVHMRGNNYRFICSGSGSRYPYFYGALRTLVGVGIEPDSILCVSGSALVMSAYASGMSLNELEDVIYRINPSDLLDPSYANIVDAVRWPFNTDGIYHGKKVLQMLQSILPSDFKKLKKRVHIVTHDLSAASAVVWSAGHHDHPLSRCADLMSLPVVVRASMSIPIVFDPVKLTHMEGVGAIVRLHADGGISANYPLDFFGSGDRVIGLRFRPRVRPRPIKNKIDIAMASLDAMLESIARKHVEDAVHARQILMDSDGSSLDFDLSKDEKSYMIRKGAEAAERWLIAQTKR